MLLKILIISKNALNSNCSELKFLQKSQWAHMSISPLSGAREVISIPVHNNILNMAIFLVP